MLIEKNYISVFLLERGEVGGARMQAELGWVCHEKREGVSHMTDVLCIYIEFSNNACI